MKIRFRFQKLDVWREARALNRLIYKLTRSFPRDEIYGLTSQLRRSSTSIASNIAEGSGRNSDKDFAHFLEQAYGSLMETASLLFLAADKEYVSEPALDPLLDAIELLAKRLAALNKSLNISHSKTPFARHPTPPQSLDSRPSTLD
jgi:four helix bundle protein